VEGDMAGGDSNYLLQQIPRSFSQASVAEVAEVAGVGETG